MSRETRESLDAARREAIERLVPAAIRRLQAYHVADAKGFIKLDAMENPYPWPETLREAWLERLRGVSVNRYPHPDPPALKARLAQRLGLPDNAGLLLGNGSDELIALLVHTLGAPRAVVLSPEPSFAMYRLTAAVADRAFVAVDLRESDFSLRLDAMLDAISRHRPALTFIAFPNNPTGNAFDAGAVRSIIEASPGVVVVDEAYAPFAEETFAGDIERNPNLLVMRTVSKLGLAGLRLGVLAGPAEWIGELDKARLPYNVNVLSQVTAEFALEHYDVFVEQTACIRRDRDAMFERLSRLNRIQTWPSRGNFFLIRAPRGEGDAVVQALRERRILVRNFNGAGPLLRDCFRVSVGMPEENDAFLGALVEILAH